MSGICTRGAIFLIYLLAAAGTAHGQSGPVVRRDAERPPKPPSELAPRPWRWFTLPALRLAIGPGWSLPPPLDATSPTALFFGLHAGAAMTGSRGQRYRGLLLQPEIGYALLRSTAGNRHSLELGLGVGYAAGFAFSFRYSAYGMVGSTSIVTAGSPHEKPHIGLRHGLLLSTLSDLVSIELSHAVIGPLSGDTGHELRLLFGVDVVKLAMGVTVLSLLASGRLD